MTHDAPVTWMPIETAPKDGTFILLHEILAQPPVSVGCYDHECGWLIAEADFMPSKCIPHHWMPLPAAPVADRVSTSSPVDDRAAPETSGKLRDAVEVWEDAYGSYMLNEVGQDYEAAAAIIEQDREAVRAEQAAEIERLRERLEIDPAHSIDGIYARDETIRGLETELAKWNALAETLAGALDKLHEAYCADDYGTSEGRAFGRTALIETRKALRKWEEARDES